MDIETQNYYEKNNELVPDEAPLHPHVKWELKDSNRGYWFVEAHYWYTGDKDPNDAGFFETYWKVYVKTEFGQPMYEMSFDMKSQYDEPLNIMDIVREVHKDIMRFYDAASRGWVEPAAITDAA